MIRSFNSKPLKLLYEKGDTSKIQPHHVSYIEEILGLLDVARSPLEMNFPGSDFHQLKGKRKGTYSVHVNGNYCITFRFENEDAVDVDYEDYH